jgi:cobalt-zinc-cadmium efflux system membrane fusion protein
MRAATTFRALLYAAILVATAAGAYMLGRSTPETAATPTQSPSVAAATSELKVDPSYLQVVGIETEEVRAGDLRLDVLAPATVTAAPKGAGVVTAHAAGTIVQIAKQLGDSVREGETLAIVESRDAATMAADRKVAETKAALARQALDREQTLYQQRVTPRQDLERAQAELAVAEAELQRTRETAAAAHLTEDGRIAIVSPLTGKVTAIAAALGKFVQPDSELFHIADPRFVQIEAAVIAGDAGRIAAGDTAKIILGSGKLLSAKVRSVTPTLDEQTRTATVVLALDPSRETLSPGDVVQADITPRAAAPSGAVIPEDAVQNVGGRNVVFVRTPTGFAVRPVVIGQRGAGRASVLSGLKSGETIATTNAFFLKAELNKGTGGDE